MPSLQEPLLKLKRADEHLKRLNAEIAAFKAARPYAVVAQKHADGEVAIVRLRINKPFPVDPISLTIGDFIQNLRASLDQLVWQLSLLENPDLASLPSHDKTVKNVQFPILVTSNTHVLKTSLKFVADADSIEQLQPYHRGDAAESDWLAILANLSNRDKHRQITPVAIRITERFTPGGVDAGFRTLTVPFQDGTHVSMVPIELIDEFGEDYHMRTSFDVLLDKRGAAIGVGIDTLSELYDYVAHTVIPLCSGPLK